MGDEYWMDVAGSVDDVSVFCVHGNAALVWRVNKATKRAAMNICLVLGSLGR